MKIRSIQPRVAALLAATVLAAAAQSDRRPRTYAIQGARIVTAAGPAIESGSLVLKDGVFAAVGGDVVVPDDAWVIDGQGLTVYPGFIDALTALGMPKAEPVYGKAPAAGPEDRPATSPWALAADAYAPKAEDVEKWRNGGFTTVVAAPSNGIVPGQSSVVNLGSGDAGGQVVEPRAALVIRLPSDLPRGNGFPRSLFGEIAYVKQLFLDARRYQQALAVYGADPAGLERPRYDRALEPLVEALEAGRTVLYPGNTATQMRRAAAMKNETSDRLVVYGAQQAYADGVAAELAAGGMRAALDVSWPEADKDADPEDDIPLRTLRFRDRAPGSARVLREAGVPFAVYGTKAKSPEDLLAGVRKAIEAGLSPDDAVRALTRGAAEIYGVSDRLGTIEPGKIANLVVYRDDPFAEKSKPVMVFIDGVKYEVSDAE